MNSPFFKKKQLSLFLETVHPYIDIHDKELFLAMLCAFLAHGEKKDKEGAPYLMHPIRVAEKVNSKDSKIVALLHDVLEDSSITAANLHEIGFSSTIIQALQAITRKKFQSYSDYLDQVAKNPLAKEVKLADIKDNLNPERLSHLDSFTQNRLSKKYTAAIKYLESKET